MSDESDPEKLIKSAYGVLQRLIKNLETGYELKIDRVEAIVIDALKQHGDHLAVHGIEQRSIDAFKFACWLGGSLLEKLERDDDHQFGIVIDALIKTLREFLIKESQWFLIMPKSCIALQKSMLLRERQGVGRHGIWMNGLYMSCHCSLMSWKEGKAYKIPL